MLRSQQRAIGWTPHDAENATTEQATLDPRTIINAPEGAALAIAALAPGITQTVITDPGGDVSLLLSEADAPQGAWAAVDYSAGRDTYAVTWWGERNLWAQVSDAYLQWVSCGQPKRPRFGITVTPDEQVLWLDHPRHRVVLNASSPHDGAERSRYGRDSGPSSQARDLIADGHPPPPRWGTAGARLWADARANRQDHVYQPPSHPPRTCG
ncbi:hypothetical protein GCM10010252_73670 [Streptomyces aureoverticillatus]|nr:hypothetical protein GCM10010252_73670 [Streptomyces aureoverticillatus]